jgi:type IV secretory pathway VirB2 component (pilin)
VALSIILQYLKIQAPAANLLPLSMLRKRLQGLGQGVDELAADVIEVVEGETGLVIVVIGVVTVARQKVLVWCGRRHLPFL